MGVNVLCVVNTLGHSGRRPPNNYLPPEADRWPGQRSASRANGLLPEAGQRSASGANGLLPEVDSYLQA